ncbi:hypothetical protein MAPG_02956 [Magnaporthiopsis poae ATCC 64411]|uniref:Uncharacterized protein n=1 Tax=Magnaporthiopsis poae (strain ATCC 64411 / 73-15) TaxID=644358 RepID=A0A0C4DSR8_MAGP6|nr:hypothetical protein MAPG_02956 [Magnaporthiopsis poae ATCC 64411]
MPEALTEFTVNTAHKLPYASQSRELSIWTPAANLETCRSHSARPCISKSHANVDTPRFGGAQLQIPWAMEASHYLGLRGKSCRFSTSGKFRRNWRFLACRPLVFSSTS